MTATDFIPPRELFEVVPGEQFTPYFAQQMIKEYKLHPDKRPRYFGILIVKDPTPWLLHFRIAGPTYGAMQLATPDEDGFYTNTATILPMNACYRMMIFRWEEDLKRAVLLCQKKLSENKKRAARRTGLSSSVGIK